MFLFIQFFIAHLFLCESLFSIDDVVVPNVSSGDFWSSVATGNVRSLHSMDLGRNFFEDNIRGGCAVDLLFQTSWGLSDSPKFFQDVINLNNIQSKFTQIFTGVGETPLGAKNSVDRLVSFLKEISIEEALFGAMIRLAAPIWSVRVGIDIPVVYKVKHPWLDESSRNKMLEEISSLFSSDALSTALTDLLKNSDKQRILNQFNSSKKTEDFGIGDLRFYIEKEFCDQSGCANLILGSEFLFPIKKVEHYIPSALKSTRKILDLSKLPDPNDMDNIPQLKDLLLGWIENIFLTSQESVFKPLLDEQRGGVGLYFRPSIRTIDQKFSIFAKVKGNYLFQSLRPKMFVTDGDNRVEASQILAQVSALSLMQAVVGIMWKPGIMFFGLGCEFFLRTTEQVLQISSAKDDSFVDFSKFINKQKTEGSLSRQYRTFLTIGSNINLFDTSFYCMLTGNYAFYSDGIFRNQWGLGFGSGFVF